MEIDKRQIVAMLKWQGEHATAVDAERELPETVDHEEHRGLLADVGVDSQDLIRRFG